jgi:flagellar protein FlgJ
MGTALPVQDLGSSLGRDARFGSLSGRLETLRETAAAASPEDMAKLQADLHQAAQDFEAMFLNLLLKEMRPEEGGLFGDNLGSDIYQELFDEELSKLMSKTGQLGLAQFIEKQVAAQIGLEEDDGTIPGEVLSRPLPTPLRLTALRTYQPLEQASEKTFERLLPPVEGVLSSPFGPRIDPIDGSRRIHKGIDLTAPVGTPIKAAADGRVAFSGTAPGYGNLVVLEHADGYETRYAHNEDNLVRKGEEVKAGQVVASVGDTGRSTGPHLHFEVRKDGRAIDPSQWLP